VEVVIEPITWLLKRKTITLNREGKPPCFPSLNATAMIDNETGSPTKRVVVLS